MKTDWKIFTFALSIGLILLGIDIFLDRTLFFDMNVSVGFLEDIPVNELFMRILVLGSFIVFGLIVSRQLYWRKLFEQKQSENAFFQRQLLNSIPAPIFHKNKNYIYTGCNDSFEKFLGKSRKDIIGNTTFDLAPAYLAKQYHEKDTELMEHPGIQVYESQVTKTDGQVLNVIFHKATFQDMHGEPDGLIGVILDITELRQAEKEKELIIAELQEALKKVNVLSGFLPICASCKKIRDDSGYWQQIEKYLKNHSDAEFSHSICPDCSAKLLANYDNEQSQKPEEDLNDSP